MCSDSFLRIRAGGFEAPLWQRFEFGTQKRGRIWLGYGLCGPRVERSRPRRRHSPCRGSGGPIFLFGLRQTRNMENNIQGLRGTSYPGKALRNSGSTLKGLQRVGHEAGQKSRTALQPFQGWAKLLPPPRVARASQPRAECWNPVGIRARQRKMWVTTRAEVHGYL